MARNKGSDGFSFKDFKPGKSSFGFESVKGASSTNQLGHSAFVRQRFRPEFNLKDLSILDDYNYASLWTRWRRGYELYMYANQRFVGLNYSFRYAVNGQAGSGGVELPGICYMFPSSKQDMAMRLALIRPRDSFNFLDFGISVKNVTVWDEENSVLCVELSERFGGPISYFTGEVLSDRFDSNGNEKSIYNNYTVVGVGTAAGGPLVPSPLPLFNALFISVTKETSWTVFGSDAFAAPAAMDPTPGDFFTTAMRFGCNCPDYLGRDDFNLYKYSTKRSYPYTATQDLKPGIYNAGTETYSGSRPAQTRDLPGFTRDFGFIYTANLLDAPQYGDSAEKSYSDQNLFYYQPRFCKHLYAAWWDMQNRFKTQQFVTPFLAQPSDEPMDGAYREYFQKTLDKETDYRNRSRNLEYWEKFSPSKNDTPTHMLYADANPTTVKVLNFDTLASGEVPALQASGFTMFFLDEYNPLIPVPPENRPIYDGGQYEDGVPVGSGAVIIYDGGRYLNGNIVRPPIFRPAINGGVY